MKDELISKVMDEVMKKMGASDATSAPAAACCNNGSANCNLTEFVGTAIGHTIGLVIANVDHQIHEKMDIDPKYRRTRSIISVTSPACCWPIPP